MQTLLIIVSGKVQGVWYRQSTKEKALELGITGEVSNLPDGTVKIIASGSSVQLDKLVNWCKTGPANAKVENVAFEKIPLSVFENFKIIR